MAENLCQRGGQEGQEVGLILNNKKCMEEMPSGDVDDGAPLQCELGKGITVESHQRDYGHCTKSIQIDFSAEGGRWKVFPRLFVVSGHCLERYTLHRQGGAFN